MSDHDSEHEIKEKFWKAMVDSPMLFLQLDSDPDSATPMTAQLDKDAGGAIWFFTRRTGHYGPGGSATCTYSAQDHSVFCRFHGILTEESDRARLEKQWNYWVEAWFPGGKDDPELLMLRMDLGDASIWDSELGPMTTIKMALGMDVRSDAAGYHRDTKLG
jgi:general stress protein 26